MGCKPILEYHCRVVTALTLTLGVNGPLILLRTVQEKMATTGDLTDMFLGPLYQVTGSATVNIL